MSGKGVGARVGVGQGQTSDKGRWWGSCVQNDKMWKEMDERQGERGTGEQLISV